MGSYKYRAHYALSVARRLKTREEHIALLEDFGHNVRAARRLVGGGGKWRWPSKRRVRSPLFSRVYISV